MVCSVISPLVLLHPIMFHLVYELFHKHAMFMYMLQYDAISSPVFVCTLSCYTISVAYHPTLCHDLHHAML